jgi:hypothetical protein
LLRRTSTPGRRSSRYGGFWPFEKIWESNSWHLKMSNETAEVIKAI